MSMLFRKVSHTIDRGDNIKITIADILENPTFIGVEIAIGLEMAIGGEISPAGSMFCQEVYSRILTEQDCTKLSGQLKQSVGILNTNKVTGCGGKA